MSKHCRTGANLTITMRTENSCVFQLIFILLIGAFLGLSPLGKGRSEGYCACEW